MDIAIAIVFLFLASFAIGASVIWIYKRTFRNVAQQKGPRTLKSAAIVSPLVGAPIVVGVLFWLVRTEPHSPPLEAPSDEKGPIILLAPSAPAPISSDTCYRDETGRIVRRRRAGFIEVPCPQPQTQSARPPGVDAQLDGLPSGSAALLAPLQVRQYEAFDVTLRLSTKSLSGLLEDVRGTAPRDSAVQGVGDVRMSNRMQAQLIGDEVDISDPGPIEQVVTKGNDTIWTWRVASAVRGRHVLRAKLYTLIGVDGKEAPRIYEAGVVDVGVTINAAGWATRHWQWIAGSIVLPLITYLLKQLLGEGSKKAGQGQEVNEKKEEETELEGG